MWPLYNLSIKSSYLKLNVGVPDLIDVRQRTSVVLRPRLRQTKLLDLLKLHLDAIKRRQTSEVVNSGGKKFYMQDEKEQSRELPQFLVTLSSSSVLSFVALRAPRTQLSEF